MFLGWLRQMVRDAVLAGVSDAAAVLDEGGGEAKTAADSLRRLFAPAQVPALPAGGGDEEPEPAKAKRGR